MNHSPETWKPVFDKLLEPEPGVFRFVADADLVAMQKFIDERKRQADPATDEWDSYATGQEMATQGYGFRMFPPNPMNDHEGFFQNYNLVLSLCTDGLHRPVFDLDFTKEQLKINPNGRGIIIQKSGEQLIVPLTESYETELVSVPSTNHLHMYSTEVCDFEEYKERLSKVPGEDASKYLANVVRVGYGSLRPPWVKKESNNDGG